MTGIATRVKSAVLLVGLATATAGCAHVGTGPTIGGRAISGPMVVPEKFGLVEQHVVEVVPGFPQQVRVKKIYTLASVDAIENSTNVRNVTRLTDYKGDYEADCPDVSPDGNSLVYQLRGDNGSIDVWTMSAESGQRAVRKTNDKALNFAPTYASNGARIIFASNRKHPSGDIWAMGAGGGIRRVTESAETDMWAHEDPVGQSIVAFTRFESGDSQGKIWVYDRNSYETTQLRDGRHPRISPDGKMIAFSAFDPQEERWDIWVMRTDGSRATRLTKNGSDNVTPSWHPSGDWIIFSSDAGTATAYLRNLDAEIKLHNFDIWITNVNGKQQTQLTTNGSDDRHPTFAPDGKSFYFSSNRGQAVDITAQDLQKYRAGKMLIGGVEYPVATGRDLWRADLSQQLGNSIRHASAQ